MTGRFFIFKINYFFIVVYYFGIIAFYCIIIQDYFCRSVIFLFINQNFHLSSDTVFLAASRQFKTSYFFETECYFITFRTRIGIKGASVAIREVFAKHPAYACKPVYLLFKFLYPVYQRQHNGGVGGV